MKRDKLKILQQVFSLIACILMLSSVVILQKGKWWGHDLSVVTEVQTADTDTLSTLNDGTIVVNTTTLGKDIVGYGGNVPLEIYVKDNTIIDIQALDNSETPQFFDLAKGLLEQWKGRKVEDAIALQVDGVTGATYSSNALKGNMKRGLEYLADHKQDSPQAMSLIDSMQFVIGLIVALMAAMLPLVVKNRLYHMAQLVLNVVVLGFWCGTFLSYSSLLGILTNGLGATTAIWGVMMVIAFVYPLFGKKAHYCTHVCPLGSLQQLAGLCSGKKWRLSQKTLRRLEWFRQGLWAVLTLLLWTRVWADWTGYELFSAFMIQSAPWIVIAVSIAFLLLSTMVVRPYCRFVCPTGMLFRICESSK